MTVICPATKEENRMNTSYTFYKDGKKYSSKGAKFEELYKLRVVRTGKVR